MFTIFTAIVFISEIIITAAICKKIISVDKSIIEITETIEEAKPKIKEISFLIKKISAQAVILSYDFVDRLKRKGNDSLEKQLSKVLISLVLWRLNSKLLNKVFRSKALRRLSRALSMMQIVI